jgi:hypothetical protein
MVLSLPGQSVGLCGQASQVAVVRLPLGGHREAERGGSPRARFGLSYESRIMEQPSPALEAGSYNRGEPISIMAKTLPHPPEDRYRKDLSEMPDWMKKKSCPNRGKFLSGKRILPKNLTGRRNSPTSSTAPFWHTTARACGKLPALRGEDAAARRDHRHEPFRRSDAGRPGLLLASFRSSRQGLWTGSSPPAPSCTTTCTSP